MSALQEENDKIQSMAVPDGKLMDVYAEDIHHECHKIQQVCTKILTLVNNKADVSSSTLVYSKNLLLRQHALCLIQYVFQIMPY